MAKTPLGTTHKYQADPLATSASKQAPQASTGANKATKGSGGKGSNKSR